MGLDGFRVSAGFGEKDSFREYVRTACRGSYNATQIPSGLEFGVQEPTHQPRFRQGMPALILGSLLGGSWVAISRVVSRVTILITHIRGLITPLPLNLQVGFTAVVAE